MSCWVLVSALEGPKMGSRGVTERLVRRSEAKAEAKAEAKGTPGNGAQENRRRRAFLPRKNRDRDERNIFLLWGCAVHSRYHNILYFNSSHCILRLVGGGVNCIAPYILSRVYLAGRWGNKGKG